MKKYPNAIALRSALEDRLSTKSKKSGIDIQRLRRNIAFDRLIVRLFQMSSPPWALKGGYAMQLRTDSARTTKDIDLAVRDASLFSNDETKKFATIRDLIIKQAALDLGDFFFFKISEPKKELDAAPQGGARFHVEALLADRSFEQFHLDIGAGDVWANPLDELQSSDALTFAGFAPRQLPAIPKEQQFAEKLHAYSLPRQGDRPNSRVKDLIDMNLLILDGLSLEKLKTSLKNTFSLRATHEYPNELSRPPQSWVTLYPKMAEECDLTPDLEVGFKTLTDFLKKL